MSSKVFITIYMLVFCIKTMGCNTEDDNLIIKFNEQLYSMTNELFTMLKLNSKFNVLFRIKPLLVMHKNLKRISVNYFKMYKDIERASKVDNRSGIGLLNITATIDNMFDEVVAHKSVSTLSSTHKLHQIQRRFRLHKIGYTTPQMRPNRRVRPFENEHTMRYDVYDNLHKRKGPKDFLYESLNKELKNMSILKKTHKVKGHPWNYYNKSYATTTMRYDVYEEYHKHKGAEDFLYDIKHLLINDTTVFKMEDHPLLNKSLYSITTTDMRSTTTKFKDEVLSLFSKLLGSSTQQPNTMKDMTSTTTEFKVEALLSKLLGSSAQQPNPSASFRTYQNGSTPQMRPTILQLSHNRGPHAVTSSGADEKVEKEVTNTDTETEESASKDLLDYVYVD